MRGIVVAAFFIGVFLWLNIGRNNENDQKPFMHLHTVKMKSASKVKKTTVKRTNKFKI